MAGDPRAPRPASSQAGAADPMPRTVFLSKQDPGEPRAFSGTLGAMEGALRAAMGGLETVVLNESAPVRALFRARGPLRRLGIEPGRGPIWRIEGMAERAAVRRCLRRARPEAVFAPVAARYFSAVPVGIPAVYCSDATFRALHGYYPQVTGLSETLRRERDAQEARSIARADLLVYSSDWAAASAVEDYGADPGRIRVVPFGANLGEMPEVPGAFREADPEAPRFLFVGRLDWHRKGGDLAIDTVAALRARGRNARITVIGCEPPVDPDTPGLTVHRYLDKGRPDQRAIFERAFLEADFFLMPSRAECSAIVFCEAAAYGLPVLACDTGGTGTIVRDGETGRLLPPGSAGADYADAVEAILAEAGRHAAMRRAARARAETVLNWTAWGRTVAEEIRALVARKGRAAG